MAQTRNYTFTPERDYGGDWKAYYRDYAANRERVNAGDDGPKQGDTRVVAKVQPVDDPPKNVASLVKYLSELGFHTQVLGHSEEKYLRGEWHPQEVVHVTAKMGKSAGWFRWVNGKPEESKVQVNGERPAWTTMTAGKKLLLGAEPHGATD